MDISRTILMGVLATGCVAAEPELADTTQHSEVANGTSFNGISLNGISLNGISLNGISLNGISLNGISLNGTDLTGVVGATMTAELSNGATLALRIDDATTGTGTNADVGMFAVSYDSDLGWQPLCGRGVDGQPVLAVAVPGVWNMAIGSAGGGSYVPSAELMTFACRGKTIAKCVELGYKPWLGREDHLASCVRLLRSDFCGDGTAYTVDGNQVNLYDALGIQTDTMAWTVEAEWTPDGARCISAARYTRFQESGGIVPPCATSLSRGKTCGVFGSGAVLIDEIPAPTSTTPTISTTTKTSAKLSAARL